LVRALIGIAGNYRPADSSGNIPELNVILGVWWRPVAGADSGGGG
jgi:hypothetical protein